MFAQQLCIVSRLEVLFVVKERYLVDCHHHIDAGLHVILLSGLVFIVNKISPKTILCGKTVSLMLRLSPILESNLL